MSLENLLSLSPKLIPGSLFVAADQKLDAFYANTQFCRSRQDERRYEKHLVASWFWDVCRVLPSLAALAYGTKTGDYEPFILLSTVFYIPVSLALANSIQILEINL
jgi:hypothetical protein